MGTCGGGLHDDGGHIDVDLDALVRQDAPSVDVDLVADGDVVAEHADVLQASPLAHGGVPADDGALHPRMVLDLGTGEDDTALQTHAVTDDGIGADGDIGTDSAVLADLGRGVDQDVAAMDVRKRGGGQELGALLGEGRQVEARARQEILGLSDVHPEAVQIEGMQLSVAADGREGLLLDGGRAQLDAREHAGVQDVDAGIDAVADELDGLLDEAVDARGVVGLVDHHPVLRGLLDLGDDDRALVAVGLVKGGEIRKGVIADDIRVEDEEGRIVLAEDGLSELEGTRRAEGLRLDGERDLDVVPALVLSGRTISACDEVQERGLTDFCQMLLHHLGPVVDGQHDVGDARRGQGFDLMQDHGLVAKLDQGLGEGERLRVGQRWPACADAPTSAEGGGFEDSQRQLPPKSRGTYERAQTCAEATDQNEGFAASQPWRAMQGRCGQTYPSS